MKAYLVKCVDRPAGCSVRARNEAEAVAKSEHWLGTGPKTAKPVLPAVRIDVAEWDAAFPYRTPTDAELEAMNVSFLGYDIPCCLCGSPMAGEHGLAHDDCTRGELADLGGEFDLGAL